VIKLHGREVSGNTYKAKLLMHLLKIEYQLIALDASQQQQKSDAFLKLNPRGEFPVLEDKSFVVWDSQAILVYLARQYASQTRYSHWYPDNATEMAHITQWLSVANDEIFHSLGKARSILKFGHDGNLDIYQKQGKTILHWIDQHLSNRNWLSTNQPSIADIACYPYIALCEEGEISLNGYPAIHRWLKRIQALDGYIPMPGLFIPDDA